MLVKNKARVVLTIQHCTEPGHGLFKKITSRTIKSAKQPRKFILQVLECSDKRQEPSDQIYQGQKLWC